VRTPALSTLLFLSGAGALVLEVCWFRRMAQVAGATSVAMAAVLAAVIGGMAGGSFLFGGRADLARRPLRLYGLLEAGIALAALLTPWLLGASQAWFDALFGHPLETPLRFLLATAVLAPPAVLMGGTLPAAACALREIEHRGRSLGFLYAANTLGAVAGTFAAGFLLIPEPGLARATRSAAVLAGGVAVVAIARGGRTAPLPLHPPAEGAAEGRRAIALYAVSGFLGLAAEVAFTRSLVLVFGSTTYAFTTMLGVFLLGIGAGGALGAPLARRARAPRRALETTLAATAALFSLGALVVYFLPRLYLVGFVAWGGGFEAGLLLRFLLALLVLLPGALGLGIAFPLAAHLATAGALGRGTGRLYAANTLASILGSTLAVFALVPALGPHYAVVAVALAGAAVAVASARRLVPAALLLVAAVGLVPPSDAARERLLSGVYFAPYGWLLGDEIDERAWKDGVDVPYHAYGREATVAVWRWYGTNSVLIDGKAVATDQILADVHHLSLLGHVPMAVHTDPQRVLVVGLGMGTTYEAIALHEPEVLRVVELEEAVVGAAAWLGVKPGDLVVADARSYLRATDETFDVITSDPIHPWVRGGGDLYTVEYFESVRARLAPGGVACQWLPVYQMGDGEIRAVVRTFASVFEQAVAYYGGGDLVLVGGERPGTPRLFEGRVRTDLEKLGAADLSVLEVARGDRLRAAAGEGPLLTDDALRLEFATPRYLDNSALEACLAWIGELWEDPPAPYGKLHAAREARAREDYGFMRLMLAEARKQAPRNAFVRRYVGELHLLAAEHFVRTRDFGAALPEIVDAGRLLGDDPRLIGIRADLFAARGEAEKAAAGYRELMERYGESAYLRRKLDAVE